MAELFTGVFIRPGRGAGRLSQTVALLTAGVEFSGHSPCNAMGSLIWSCPDGLGSGRVAVCPNCHTVCQTGQR